MSQDKLQKLAKQLEKQSLDTIQSALLGAGIGGLGGLGATALGDGDRNGDKHYIRNALLGALGGGAVWRDWRLDRPGEGPTGFQHAISS